MRICIVWHKVQVIGVSRISRSEGLAGVQYLEVELVGVGTGDLEVRFVKPLQTAENNDKSGQSWKGLLAGI